MVDLLLLLVGCTKKSLQRTDPIVFTSITTFCLNVNETITQDCNIIIQKNENYITFIIHTSCWVTLWQV